NCTITGVIICQKAKEYATRLGINEFSASKEKMTSNNLVDDNSEIEDEDFQLLIDQMNDDIGIIRARDYIEIDNNLRT
ncbi:11431_t:CDS:2, partial [Entrophospora sp. SA101]